MLEALYRNALALVCVSEEEGYGFTPLEAIARGTPAVVSDLPVFDETLREGALRVPRGDSGALADALLRLERDAGLRRAPGGGRSGGARADVVGQRGRRDPSRAGGGGRVSEFAIVTVIHDSAAELEVLLASIERFLDPRPQLVVVDSGSTRRRRGAARGAAAPRSSSWTATAASARPATRGSSGCPRPSPPWSTPTSSCSTTA